MSFSVPTADSLTQIGITKRNAGDPDTSIMTVAGLDGDLADYYVVEYRVIQPAPFAACDYMLLPNGSVALTESADVANGGAVQLRSNKGLILGLTGVGRFSIMGRYLLYTSRTPFGSATTRARNGFGLATVNDAVPAGSNIAIFSSGGAWSSADNLTSLAIATHTLDTTTQINRIAPGSYMRVLAPLRTT